MRVIDCCLQSYDCCYPVFEGTQSEQEYLQSFMAVLAAKWMFLCFLRRQVLLSSKLLVYWCTSRMHCTKQMDTTYRLIQPNEDTIEAKKRDPTRAFAFIFLEHLSWVEVIFNLYFIMPPGGTGAIGIPLFCLSIFPSHPKHNHRKWSSGTKSSVQSFE